MSAVTGATTQSAVPKKRLIICCDGTWNDSVSTKSPLTNVSRISRCIKPIGDRGNVLQIVYYHTGIGTGTSKIGKSVDGATGRGIGANVRDAYSFICHNYHDENDEIFLIGFSRGAFTVRCVAKLIDQVGVLRKRGLNSLYEVYRLWKGQHEPGDPKSHKPPPLRSLQALCAELKDANLLRAPVEITACAVWDTVSAMGLPAPIGIPQPKSKKLAFVDESLCQSIKHAYHALALDERRRQFKPLLWRSSGSASELKQCWFLGAHSDVGGGYEDAALANITLIWMIAQLDRFLDFDFDTLWDLTAARVVKTIEYFEQHGEKPSAGIVVPIDAVMVGQGASVSVDASFSVSHERPEKYSRDTVSETKPAVGKVKKSLAGVFRLGGAIKRIPGQLQTVQESRSSGIAVGLPASTVASEVALGVAVDVGLQVTHERLPIPEYNHNHSIHFTVRVMLGEKMNTCRTLENYYTELHPDADYPKVSWKISKQSATSLNVGARVPLLSSHGLQYARTYQRTDEDTIPEDRANERELELLRECMKRDIESRLLKIDDTDTIDSDQNESEGSLSKIMLPLLSEAEKPKISVSRGA